MPTTRHRTDRAFTLVELLVVVAVIALLIGILVPALGGARKEAQRLTISNNLRSIALAANAYAANGVLPPSYVYASKEGGTSWKTDEQFQTHPNPRNGYIHWSYAIMGEDTEESEAFESPLTTNGGAPRTNPGPRAEDWELEWQRDDTQNGTPQIAPKDRQAARVAFGGNHVIFPRNKFRDPAKDGNPLGRKNILVNPAVIKAPGRVILATEFLDLNNWQSITEGVTPDISKSHRPLSVIKPASAVNVYGEIDRPGRTKRQFYYPELRNIVAYDDLRASSSDQVSQLGIDGTDINAISREHPGGNSTDGGTTHFVFLDGHVEKLLLKDTILQGLWGDRFYSLSGSNTQIFNPNDN